MFQSCYSSKRSSQGQRQLQAAQLANLSRTSPITSPIKSSRPLPSSTPKRPNLSPTTTSSALAPSTKKTKRESASNGSSKRKKKETSPPSRYGPIQFITIDEAKGGPHTTSEKTINNEKNDGILKAICASSFAKSKPEVTSPMRSPTKTTVYSFTSPTKPKTPTWTSPTKTNGKSSYSSSPSQTPNKASTPTRKIESPPLSPKGKALSHTSLVSDASKNHYKSSYDARKSSFDYLDFPLLEEEERDDDKDFRLDVDYFAGGTRSRLQGLRNLGNTCYMNAILQVLTNLNPFVLDLKQSYERSKARIGFNSTFCEAFLSLVNEKAQKSGVVDPKPLKDKIGQVVERFSGYSQQDAHEFLGSCLNQIEEEMKVKESKLIPNIKQQCPVSQLFDFTLEHTLTCCKCGNTSIKQELCRDLSLSLTVGRQSSQSEEPSQEIVLNDTVRLEKLLDKFFQTDRVESLCEVCGDDKQEAKHKIKTKPSVLILHLKRFQATFEYGLPCTTKITTPVHFEDRLDLSFWCNYRNGQKLPLWSETNDLLDLSLEALMDRDSSGPLLPVVRDQFSKLVDSSYKLKGVVVHEGYSTSSGHYICDIYDELTETWSTYNDSLVLEKVSSSTVFGVDRQANAYILFYHKENTS